MGASCAVIRVAGFPALQVGAEVPEATRPALPVLAADDLRARDTTGAVLGHDRGSARDFHVRRGRDRAFRDRLRARDPVHGLHRHDRGRGQQEQRYATGTKTKPCCQAGANFFETFLSLVGAKYDLHYGRTRRGASNRSTVHHRLDGFLFMMARVAGEHTHSARRREFFKGRESAGN